MEEMRNVLMFVMGIGEMLRNWNLDNANFPDGSEIDRLVKKSFKDCPHLFGWFEESVRVYFSACMEHRSRGYWGLSQSYSSYAMAWVGISKRWSALLPTVWGQPELSSFPKTGEWEKLSVVYVGPDGRVEDMSYELIDDGLVSPPLDALLVDEEDLLF